MASFDVPLDLTDKAFQTCVQNLLKDLPVAIRKRLAGDFFRKNGRQAVMVVDARVVVPGGG